MTKKIIFSILIIVLLVLLIFFAFYLSNKPPQDQSSRNEKLKIEELMSIIRKSPDYPDFLRIIKANDFDAELVEYYYFSPEAYKQKIAEWEQTKNEEMKEMEQIFNTLELNENCYLVRLKSKTNSANGLTAVINVEDKEPLVIVAEIAREMGAGM